MLFFIATVGRSGSRWLAEVLDQSPSHSVRHEDADPRYGKSEVLGWEPFPLDRFLANGPNYGEVHGFLRYNLSGNYRGLEKSIPRRGILERSSKEVVRSWMRNGHVDFGACAFEVLTQQRLLREYAMSDPQCRVFNLRELTTDLGNLQELCDWVQVGYVAGPEDLENRHQTEPQRDWEWNEDRSNRFDRIANSLNFEPIQ